MSLQKIRKTLLDRIDDKTIAIAVSKALRQEYADLTTAIKRIGRITGIDGETISKWYRGLHAPKSAHLLMLAAHYPKVLYALFKLIGRDDLWHITPQSNMPQSMHSYMDKECPTCSIRGDRFVTPYMTTSSQIGIQFNLRQLWFFEQLREGNHLLTRDIFARWSVKERTAKRDIAGLVRAGLIRFRPAGKTGWYEVIT